MGLPEKQKGKGMVAWCHGNLHRNTTASSKKIELQGLGWVFSASAEEGGVVCEFCGGRRGELGCPGFKRERGWLTVNRARAR
jgi:hypothetical protein